MHLRSAHKQIIPAPAERANFFFANLQSYFLHRSVCARNYAYKNTVWGR